MSDSAAAPGSSNVSPAAPVGNSPPPVPDASSPPSPPTPSNAAVPPPKDSSTSAPPPISKSSPPPTPSQSPPPVSPPPKPSNSSSTSPPPTSPPPPSSIPPPAGSLPPKSPPPANSNSSPPPPHNSSPPPPSPSFKAPPVSSSPPPAPSQSNTPPPTGGATPPSSQDSTPPPPPPSKGSTVGTPPDQSSPPPASAGAVPPPPTQTLSPPLPMSPSPPGETPSPVPPSTPTPSNETSRTSSTSTSPPSNTSHHVPTPSAPSTNSKNNSSEPPSASKSPGTGSIVGVTVAGVVILALVAIVFLIIRKRKRKSAVFSSQYMPPNNFSIKSDGYYYGPPHTSGGSSVYTQPLHSPKGNGNSYGSQRGNMYNQEPNSNGIGGPKSWFSYEELMEITNGFSRQNILGEGGFGCVYKGWLPDGRIVAVKQLKAGSGQGEREFQAEVEIISRVHHRHLVSLVGYCISEQQRLLIYEYVPNQTLEHHLHGLPVLDWTKRVKIALGAARGLAYLHEDCHPKIIHRDIKSANILLDDVFEAQVADFGLAKLTNDTHTHVSTRVMGTFGYMAPEYASSGKLTDRSDVFSFGVVLLELVTGRKPVDPTQPLGDESLVEWARPHLVRALDTGDFSELVDSRLEKNYVEHEMFRMIEAAAACVRHSAPKRPRMMQVARALDCEGESSDLSNGVKYGQSTVYESGQYNQDIMRFRRMAFGSGDSKEYDMSSGEYTSREVSRGPPNAWKSTDNSSEFTSGESETRAINANYGEQVSGEVRGTYGARRF